MLAVQINLEICFGIIILSSWYLILHHLFQVRGKIGDFITGVFSVFQGIMLLVGLIVSLLAHSFNQHFNLKENKVSYFLTLDCEKS